MKEGEEEEHHNEKTVKYDNLGMIQENEKTEKKVFESVEQIQEES